VIVTTVAGTGFVEMRLGKVVGIATAEDDVSCCVVLEAMSGGRHLPIQIVNCVRMGWSRCSFTISSVSFGMRYPFSRNAVPKALSLGNMVWQVWQLVAYLRAKAGIASADRTLERARPATATRTTRTVVRQAAEKQVMTASSRLNEMTPARAGAGHAGG
jgi:hypothetical protein